MHLRSIFTFPCSPSFEVHRYEIKIFFCYLIDTSVLVPADKKIFVIVKCIYNV